MTRKSFLKSLVSLAASLEILAVSKVHKLVDILDDTNNELVANPDYVEAAYDCYFIYDPRAFDKILVGPPPTRDVEIKRFDS